MRNSRLCQHAVFFRYQPGYQLGYLLAVVLTLVCPTNASAQRAVAQEGAIKAAFVYNFAKFTDWPEELWGKSSTLQLCTAGGKNAFSQALTAIHRQLSIRGKDIEVIALTRPQETSRCHLLVVTGVDSVREWLRSARNLPVLTVSDAEGFAAIGGAIGLFVEGNQVKFEINQDAAHRSGIKLSSRLLQLARLVKDDSGGIR